MDREIKILTFRFNIPAASMTLFDTLAIIVLVPVYDKIINPYL